MRLRIALTAVLLASLVLAVIPVTVRAVTIDSMTPLKGKVGQTGVVHGTGFEGNAAAIKFGAKSADDIKTVSDQLVKFKVPATDASDRLPSDASKVRVTVTIGDASAGFVFQYTAPGQEPTITAFDPPSVPSSTEIQTTVLGRDFTNPQGRTPTSTYLVETGTAGVVTDVDPEGQSLVATFVRGDPFPPGIYTVIVGFSDGSAASLGGLEVV